MNLKLKNQMSDISVLIPSYNHAPFVERTLRSIFKQTHAPKNLIVIDDGSKDESVEVIQRVLTDCPFPAELIARENRGLCATLNEGFARSEGEFFAYIGSDDVWLPSFLAEQIGLLERRPGAVLAFGHAFLIDEKDRVIDCTKNWTDFADGDVLPYLLRGQVFSSPSVVYRRSTLEKYGWNEDAALEDYELYLKLSADGEFARNEKVLCGWRQHGWNVSGNFPKMFSEWIAAQNRQIKSLRLSRDELDRLQTELKFDAVASFVRHGYRREGAALFWNNLSGAKSPAHVGKTLVRLAVPQRIFQWNRRRKRRKTIEKYGKLEI